MNIAEDIQKETVETGIASVSFENADLCASVPARFARVMRCMPQGHPAYVGEEGTVTYEALDRQSDHLAHAILERIRGPVGGQKPVALLLPHNASSLIGILGVLKTGHFYVPLAPEVGEVYHTQAVTDCPPDILVTTRSFLPNAQSLIASCPHVPILLIDDLHDCNMSVPLAEKMSPETVALILFTSGSTGKPHGVIRNHGQLLSSAYLAAIQLRISANDRVAHMMSFTFSASTMLLYGALLNGATVYSIFPRNIPLSTLYQWLFRQQVTVMGVTPAVLRGLGELADGYPQLASIHTVSVGGETINRQDVPCMSRILPTGCRLLCAIGSAETGHYAHYVITVGALLEDSKMPVGYATEHVSLSIVDEMGRQMAPDNTGQISVRSRYLSPGYWKSPDLTASRFFPDPDGGDRRIFLTGDLGWMKADGLLYHMGRMDNMVKIRGFRVEPNTIETALMTHPALSECAVVARSNRSGESRLVAYVVTRQLLKPSVRELRVLLAKTLPSYMVPTRFLFLERLPRNINGKIDRFALPAPSVIRPELDTPFVAPHSELEQQLADIWAELLELDEVGVADNFFELGGDSITAIRMMQTVEERIGCVNADRFFRHPTIAEMAGSVADSAEQNFNRQYGSPAGPVGTGRRRFNLRAIAESYLSSFVNRGPIWGDCIMPYGIGIRLQRLLVMQPWYQRLFYARQLETVKKWQVYLGMPVDHRSLTLNLFVNTWMAWRDLVLIQPSILDRWVTLGGEGRRFLEPSASSCGMIIVLHHAGRMVMPLQQILRSHGWRTATITNDLMIQQTGDISIFDMEQARSHTAQLWQAKQVLEKNGVALIAGDGLRGKQSVDVAFFGRQRSFQIGAAALAVTTGALFLPAFITYHVNGTIYIEIMAPLTASEGTNEDQIHDLTRQYGELYASRWPQFYETMQWNHLEYNLPPEA